MPGWHRGLRLVAPLIARAPSAWPYRAPDATSLREALCQTACCDGTGSGKTSVLSSMRTSIRCMSMSKRNSCACSIASNDAMSLMSVISSSCQSKVTHSNGTQCNTSYFNHGPPTKDPYHSVQSGGALDRDRKMTVKRRFSPKKPLAQSAGAPGPKILRRHDDRKT